MTRGQLLWKGFPLSKPSSPPDASPAPAAPPHELLLLLTLAGMQFTNILDFMIMMPLAPQLMRLFDIGPREFGLLVSAYTFAAAASGFVAAFWIDRFGRRRTLLAMYTGFIVATALCGLAPNFWLLGWSPAITPATIRSGKPEAVPNTPTAANTTATLPMASLREQIHTLRILLSPSR